MREYDEISDWFADTRRRDPGVPDVTAFARSLPPGARVLDLGCGTGVPITQCLIAEGCEVYAIDSSAKMIERFRAAFPGVPAACERIQDSTFFDTTFDGIVAWGVLFHLDATDQEAAIARMARALKPGGRLFFTSADVDATSESEMQGLTFTYVSLGSAAYARVLRDHGLVLIDEHNDAWDNYVYIATKA
jgi:2-polyprenyl-3-methyl-5-hydroxy-6-metoxy-1,4-benzoquinol methylase